MPNLIPRLIFKLAGWKITGNVPAPKKYVLVAAPHTSNWDFVYGLCAWKLYGIKLRYLIKKEFFFFPLNLLFKATGGMAVDRSKSNSLTEAIVDMYTSNDELVALFPPEGTRKRVNRWKTGFYYVALKAKVPLVMGFMDYKYKITYLSEPFMPSGDIEKDFEILRAFYKEVHPKNPEGFNPEGVRPA